MLMGHQRKEKQENTRAAISLDDTASLPGSCFWSKVKVVPFTKENKGLVERIINNNKYLLLIILFLLLFTDCPTITWFVYCFPLVGMLALKDAILEVYLYQKEANIICHAPAFSGYSLTAKSPWEANRSFRYYRSKASWGFSARLCLPTESRLGCDGAVETSPCSCPDLPPWNMRYVSSQAVNKWYLPGAGNSGVAQLFAVIYLLISWGTEAHACMCS